MRHSHLQLVAALAVLAGCGKRTPSPPLSVDADASKEFTLARGQEASLSGDAGSISKVRFVQVTDDTRCLKGDSCPQSTIGTARVEVQAVKGDARHTIFLSFASRGAPEHPDVVPCIPFGDRTLRVTDVTPWPRNGKAPDKDEYRVSFLVSTTCQWVAPAP